MYMSDGNLNDLVRQAMISAYNHGLTDARLAILELEWKAINNEMYVNASDVLTLIKKLEK